MAKYLTDLADVLRKAGLDVVEIPGWKTRGRPGDFDPQGVLCHHTAGAGDGYNDAYAMATKGRPDLNPPLAQLALSRNGTWFVLAAGRANHAGKCRAVGGLTAGDGNAQLLGVEAQNRGTDAEDWSPAQYGSYVRGVAALTAHYGWRPPLGHKETSTSGKVDPDFPMDKFRRDVAATNLTAAPQEDDMPDPRDLWAYEYKGRQALSYLVTADANARAARADAAAALELAKAQAAAGRPLTSDEITEAVRAALEVEATVVVKGVEK